MSTHGDMSEPPAPSAPLEATAKPRDISYAASGFKGVDIQFKALEHYVSALSSPGPVKPATEYLAEKLYLFQEPHAVSLRAVLTSEARKRDAS